MLAIRHSLSLGEATCAYPLGLSAIGKDTLDCTEAESELQMGLEREKENKANRCGVNSYMATESRSLLLYFGPKPQLHVLFHSYL